MNHVSKGQWQAYSAGSKPTGTPNPFALETLSRHELPITMVEGPARSKSWDEFASEDAPIMDVVVTVCDNAANEPCPVWPRRADTSPQLLHWGFPDPAAATGSDEAIRNAFETVFQNIKTKIDAFLGEQSTFQK